MTFVLDRPDLGWREQTPDDPDVVALREELAANNGIPGLEIVDPDDVARAVRIFRRDGFVAVAGAVTGSDLETMQAACLREVEAIMEIDGDRGGNRGSHRYSFGSSSLTGHMAHHPEWAMLIDNPVVAAIITGIFDSPDYRCRGGGGDFCLPGTLRYQPLHTDILDRRTVPNPNGEGDVTLGSFHDPRDKLTMRDLPCMYVAANFLMNDFSTVNGPTRQIPGTQNSHQPIPTLDEEPDWMRFSTVCPAPAGTVLLRDPRAWRGGTPNLSTEVRCIPNAEFYAPWFYEPTPVSMPKAIYQSLSDHGRHICRYLVSARGENPEFGYRGNLGGTPGVFRTPDGPPRPGT
ncbi:MAG: phytanoyl-CoA dioxygenase family protein [Actinomycetia bacterium]|nr:phytanoyl-CoA dioxygenase family protein [Actinomycetes bacterium]